MMFKIKTKSPTRVDLAGGTLDCWPLSAFYDSPYTVNMSISVFTTAELHERADQKVSFAIAEQSPKIFNDLKSVLSDESDEYSLLRVIVSFWQPKSGFDLRVNSESPIGGGLGGSSSLTISIMKAFAEWLKRPMSPLEMIKISSHLEANLLKTPTGTQDYFPPLWPGINVIRYAPDGPNVKQIRINEDFFKERFALVYSGKTHHSGLTNWGVLKAWIDGDQIAKSAMSEIANVSKKMAQLMMQANWSDQTALDFKNLIDDEFRQRLKLSNQYVTTELQTISDIAQKSEASLKICGAGGGGCGFIWSPDRKISKIISEVKESGFRVLDAHPWWG